MNPSLESVLMQAKKFDDEYVKTNTQTGVYDLYCLDQTLIKSYIIAKALTTDDLNVTIVSDPYGLPHIAAEFTDILNKSDLGKKLKRSSRGSITKPDNIIFKNESLIYFSDYDRPRSAYEDTEMDIFYVCNSALDSLFGLENLENFENMITDTTRFIYNYDP